MNKTAQICGLTGIVLSSTGAALVSEADAMSRMPEHSPAELEMILKSRPYTKQRNGVEVIEYNKNLTAKSNDVWYMPVKYYSHIDKKTNEMHLKKNQMIYDGIIIEGQGWFKEKTAKALDLLREKCKEDYLYIRDGETRNGEYHRGCGRIFQRMECKGTTTWKERDMISVGTAHYNDDLAYYATGFVNEGYRLVNYDEWNKLEPWQNEQEGIKAQLDALKKINPNHHSIPRLNKLLNAKTKKELSDMWNDY